jgi:hypothetical protein
VAIIRRSLQLVRVALAYRTGFEENVFHTQQSTVCNTYFFSLGYQPF